MVRKIQHHSNRRYTFPIISGGTRSGAQATLKRRRCPDCKECNGPDEFLPEKTLTIQNGWTSTIRYFMNKIGGKYEPGDQAHAKEIEKCRKDLYLGKIMFSQDLYLE